METRIIAILLISTFFCCCSNTKHVTELQNKIHILQKELLKKQQKNADLKSFVSSLKIQLIKNPNAYMRICQLDSSITTESLNLKYDNLLEKYNQLQASHKSLEENYEVDKTNSAKAISTLKSQYDKVVHPNKNKKILKVN